MKCIKSSKNVIRTTNGCHGYETYKNWLVKTVLLESSICREKICNGKCFQFGVIGSQNTLIEQSDLDNYSHQTEAVDHKISF